jgi:RNA polymerase sigma factor (TIGR02999 family)
MNDPLTNREEITRILKACGEGNREALDGLMDAVYEELCRLAQWHLKFERSNHTLQTNALVNEAYMALVDQRSTDWQNRSHFFGVASTLMRRILVNHAKGKKRLKRGGGNISLSLDEAVHVVMDEKDETLIALDEALTKLSKKDQRQAKIVELRYFGGLTIEETAKRLNIAPATVKREWEFARAWLRREIKDQNR